MSQITSFLRAEVPCDFLAHFVEKQTYETPSAVSVHPFLPVLPVASLLFSGLLQGGPISGLHT